VLPPSTPLRSRAQCAQQREGAKKVEPPGESRIVLTVPGIIIMVPGIYGFQTIVLLNQGDMLAAMQAAALGGFIVGAMSLGLTAARFITERRWLIES
jgi:hypothetical protein